MQDCSKCQFDEVTFWAEVYLMYLDYRLVNDDHNASWTPADEANTALQELRRAFPERKKPVTEEVKGDDLK